MVQRIAEELALLRKFYPESEYKEEGHWILIKDYPIITSIKWSSKKLNICFQIPAGYPGAAPDCFYIPKGTLCDGKRPNSYTEPVNNAPPFKGTWGIFSWHIQSGWQPTAKLESGSNLLNFVRTFNDRFAQGA